MWKLLAQTSKTMGRIPQRSMELLTILFFIIGISNVESATVSAGGNKVGMLGDNQNVSITCTYTLDTGESAQSMTIQRRRSNGGTYINIATYNIPANTSLYADSSLQPRSQLMLMDGSASIMLINVLCSDAASYKCAFGYGFNGIIRPMEDTMTLSLQAEPEGKPGFNSGNPNSRVFVEHDQMRIECEADVGLPAGNILWYGFKGDEVVDLTSSAVEGPPFQISSGARYCAFRRTSTLTLNLTRQHNEYIFRCSVNHTTHTARPDETCIEAPCVQSQRIAVEYPVLQENLAISSNPAGNEFIVGSRVTFTCTVDGNPAPQFRWFKENDVNKTHEGSNQWVLSNLQLGDTGTYSCHGSNTVGGVMYNVSQSININVVETTTPAPTTSTAPSTTQETGGNTDSVKPPPEDESGKTNIIIIVCVIIGVVLIVAIIVACIIIRRKKKQNEVEEPPEKPFNKNNLSMYSTKPDLVSDEKKNINFKNDDGLTYADLKFDDKPRSRRPVALADSMTDYADITIPQV